jgi:hypothetical protein
MEMGPWALATMGKPSVATLAAAALLRKRRRGASTGVV